MITNMVMVVDYDYHDDYHDYEYGHDHKAYNLEFSPSLKWWLLEWLGS